MAKIGRNERCPCGSGNKYKHCCEKLQEWARTQLERAATRDPAEIRVDRAELHELSHDVVDLLEEGLVDEAEALARRMMRDWPAELEGFQCLGDVEHVRGHAVEAAQWYRRGLALHQASSGHAPSHAQCSTERYLREALQLVEQDARLERTP